MKALFFCALILSAAAFTATPDIRPAQHPTQYSRLLARELPPDDLPDAVPARHGWNIDAVDAVETGIPQGACVVGNYAYLGFAGVIAIFDVTNPAFPKKVGFAITPGTVVDFCRRGNYLYCGNYPESSLQVFDITNPTAPNLIASIAVDGYRLDVEGNYLYAEDGLDVRVYDVTIPSNPIPLSDIPSTNVHSIYDIEAAGAYLYVGRNASLQIVDVTNPASPIELAILPVSGSPYALAAVSPTYLYALTFFTAPALRIIDVSNPQAPSIVKEVSAGLSYDISVQGDLAYLLDGGSGAYLRVLDISDPLNPVVMSQVRPCDMTSATCLGVGGNVAVIGDYFLGTCFLDVSNPTFPRSRNHYEALPFPHSVDASGGFLAVSLEYGNLGWVDRFDLSIHALVVGTGGWIDNSHVVVQGNHAFMAMNDSQFNNDSGLEVFDISDPHNPFPVGHLDTPWLWSPPSVGSIHVYLPTYQGLWVIDVSDPSQPTKIGELAISAADVFAVEPYLFASSGGNLRVIDVSNPALPDVAMSVPLGANSFGLWVEGSFAYISTGTKLWVVNVANPLQPIVVGSFTTSSLWSVRVRGQFAYLSDYPFLRILDITNPALPVEVGNIETPGVDNRVAVAPPFIYAVVDYGPLLKYETPWITDARPALGMRLGLKQNYPNPFNPSTTIAFETPSSGHVRLDVFDVRGRRVRTLVDESMPAGAHLVTWDGRDNAGNTAGSGVYFYRLAAGGKSEAKKMMILK